MIDHKHKAFTAIREEIIKDANHEAWVVNKKLVIEIPEDKVQERDEQATIVYDEVKEDVNFATYRMYKQRVVDIVNDPTPTTTTASVVYSDILKDVNFSAFKATGSHIVNPASGTKTASVVVNYSDVMADADRVSWKLTGVNLLTPDRGGSESSLEISFDDVKKAVDWISWKVGNCRIADNPESKAEVQADNSISGIERLKFSFAKAIANIYRELGFCTKSKKVLANGLSHSIEFTFDKRWNGSYYVLLQLMNKYVESFALYEWFKVVMPSEASPYLAESEKILSDIVNEAKSDYQNDSWLQSIWKQKIGMLNDIMRLNLVTEAQASVESVTFNLAFSGGWMGSKEAMTSYAHRFLVESILKDWYELALAGKTYNSEEELYRTRIIEELNSIEDGTDWFNRTYKAALARVKDDMRANILLSETTEADGKPNDYTFTFKFSDSWRGSIESLSSYINHFIVSYILSEWMILSSNENAAKYEDMAESWRSKMIDEALSEDQALKWFNRMWESAITQVRDILRAHIYLNDTIPADDDYTFRFRFPNTWKGSISTLKNYIHRYVVDYIISEWLRLNNKKEASGYIANIEEWLQKITGEIQSEYENAEWFERQLATAVDHLKGRLRWCIHEHTGTIIDDIIKKKALVYGEEDYPAVSQDPSTFEDDEAFLDAPAEKHIPMPEHTFRFRFSPEWRGNFESLGNYIHRYIVDYILYEWFKITLPSEAAVYLTSAEQWESKIINEARSEDVRNVYFRL